MIITKQRKRLHLRAKSICVGIISAAYPVFCFIVNTLSTTTVNIT